jgi:hypothetical protein
MAENQKFMLTFELTAGHGIQLDTLWTAHCLQLDIVSCASQPHFAIEAVAESIAMVIANDVRSGMSPVNALRAHMAVIASRK